MHTKAKSRMRIDDDAKNMIKLGLGLLILVALVVALFALFSVGKNTANDGLTNLQSTLGKLQNSIVNDFDQKTVSGSQVMGSLDTFNGKPVAVIIKTCKGSWVNYNAIITPFSSSAVSQATSPFSGLSKDATSKQYTSNVSYFDKTSGSLEIGLVMSNAADEDKKVVLYNNITVGLSKIGGVNYVDPTATFNTYLVRDAGDLVIGVVAIQQGKHTAGT